MKTVDPSPAGSPLLVFDSVGFTYPGRDAPILKDLSFVVPAGGFVSVEGPSGGGKSTLLRLACRLEVPDSGQVLLDGRPAAAMAPEALRREVCCVQQTPTLLPASVRANLLLPFGFRVNADRRPPDDALLRRRLDDFHLDAVELHHGAQTLSVGQKQRLCVLRAMLLSPRMLLLDEPTAALDRDNARRVRDVIERLNRDEGVTVMMVSHNAEDARAATVRIRIGGGG